MYDVLFYVAEGCGAEDALDDLEPEEEESACGRALKALDGALGGGVEEACPADCYPEGEEDHEHRESLSPEGEWGGIMDCLAEGCEQKLEGCYADKTCETIFDAIAAGGGEREPTDAELSKSAALKQLFSCYLSECEGEDSEEWEEEEEEWRQSHEGAGLSVGDVVILVESDETAVVVAVLSDGVTCGIDYRDGATSYEEIACAALTPSSSRLHNHGPTTQCAAGQPERGKACSAGTQQQQCRVYMQGVTKAKLDAFRNACAGDEEMGGYAPMLEGIMLGVATSCGVRNSFNPNRAHEGGAGDDDEVYVTSTVNPAADASRAEREAMLAKVKAEMDTALQQYEACFKDEVLSQLGDACDLKYELYESLAEQYEEMQECINLGMHGSCDDDDWGGMSVGAVVGIVVGILLVLVLLVYVVFQHGKTVGAKMPNEPSFTVLGGGGGGAAVDGGRALENPEYGDVQGVAEPVRSEYEA